MKLLAAFIIMLLSVSSYSATVKIAVIDTGFGPINGPTKLCSSGHRDFTTSNSILDEVPSKHGTNIASLIEREAGSGDYCLVILKVYNKGIKGIAKFNLDAYYEALKYAINTLKPNVINLSISGKGRLEFETQLITKLLNMGTVIVVAAGNEKIDFDKEGCIVYPACIDPRIYVVANLKGTGTNYGAQVDSYENGIEQTAGGTTLTGSSQAAAVFTGKAVKKGLEYINGKVD